MVVEPVDESDVWLLGGLVLPGIELLKTLLDVIQPRSERSGGLEGKFEPGGGHLVDEDLLHEHFHLLSHGQLTLVGQLNLSERSDDLLDEDCDGLALLDEHVLVRTTLVFLELADDIVNVGLVLVKLGFVLTTAHELSELGLNGIATFTASSGVLGLKLDEHSEERLALSGSEVNFSVGVHTEGERCLGRQLSLDVLLVVFVGGGGGALEDGLSVSEGEHVGLVKKTIVHEVLEETRAEDTVEIIDDVTTVHDITEDVTQIIPRDLSATSILVKIVLQHNS